MLRTIFASDLFRLALVPIATASLGCYIRYFSAKFRKKKIRKAEIFTIWPELLTAALFNILLLASDVAKAPKADSDIFLGLLSAGMLILFLLWLASFMAAIPRSSPLRTRVWTHGFPHVVALGGLEFSLLLATYAQGG